MIIMTTGNIPAFQSGRNGRLLSTHLQRVGSPSASEGPLHGVLRRQRHSSLQRASTPRRSVCHGLATAMIRYHRRFSAPIEKWIFGIGFGCR